MDHHQDLNMFKPVRMQKTNDDKCVMIEQVLNLKLRSLV